eukprot:m.42302 g.42302  ORF g.42302 m.42302 type:complete len:482 (+) comp19064_c0_seq1:310-1755(+)
MMSSVDSDGSLLPFGNEMEMDQFEVAASHRLNVSGFNPARLLRRTTAVSVSDRARREKLDHRIVAKKKGTNNTRNENMGRNKLGRKKFNKDGFHVMLETSWTIVLLVFVLTYFTSWVLFGALWHFLNLFDGSCVAAMESFNGALEFSVETQQTIGYGDKFIRENCVGGTVLMAAQELVGRLCDCFWIGLIFLKMSRPKKRSATLHFSQKACVTVDKENTSKTQLTFRVGDTTEALSSSPWVNSMFKLYMFSTSATSAGVHRAFKQQKMKLVDARPLLILPIELCHDIDEKSPLYGLNEQDLIDAKVELVLVFESVIQSSGNSVHSRTSYTARDLSWGRMFSEMCFRDDLKKCPVVDWSLFDSTIPDTTFNDRTQHDGARLGIRRNTIQKQKKSTNSNPSSPDRQPSTPTFDSRWTQQRASSITPSLASNTELPVEDPVNFAEFASTHELKSHQQKPRKITKTMGNAPIAPEKVYDDPHEGL